MSKVTELIAKILNQAENAGTEAEAEVFMKKAQQMATQYSVDLAVARNLTVAKERTTPIVRTVTLGERKTRGLNTYVALISGIASANNVKANIAHNSTYVILFGFEEDIDIVEALYASLLVQMITASEAFKKEGSWKEDTVQKPVYETEQDEDWYGRPVKRRYFAGYEYKPVSWLSARLDFQNAFASKVGTRLYFAKMEAEKNAEEASDDAPGTALVLANKAVEVADFYKQKSTARGTYRGARTGIASGRAYSAGRTAGENARLTSSAAIANKAALSA